MGGVGVERWNGEAAGWLARIYAAYGVLAIGLLFWAMPGFQNPDEVSHLLRAESVSRGWLAVPVMAGAPGGAMPSVVPDAAAPYQVVRMDPGAKVTRAMMEQSNRVRWSGVRGPGLFANTAIYPPVLYAPQAVAVLVGRALDLTVMRTLTLGRVAAGIAGVLLGAVAIAGAGGAAPLLFALLALPMSLSSIVSVSQDALMLPLAALAAGRLASAARGARDGPGFAGTCVALGLVIMARPPYAPMALAALAWPGVRMRGRVLAVAAMWGAAAAWAAVAAAVTGIVPLPGTDPAAQLAWWAADAGTLPRLAWATLRTWGGFYARSFIGQPGWLDVLLPGGYYALAWVGLAVAVALSLGPGGRNRGLLAAAALGSVGLVFIVQALTWTPVGAPVIDGVQGRYLLAPAMLLAPALGGVGVAQYGLAWRAGLYAVAALPMIGIAVLMRAVVSRYYLG